MINCRQLVELLLDFVSGDLDEDRCRHVEQHLGRCPPCVVYLETYRITIRLSRQLPSAAVPPELLARLRAALEASGEESPCAEQEKKDKA